jgi:high-affinity Fe2+/Pb2+ permease
MTGIALVALGATLAVLSRFRSSATLRLVVAAHLCVYSTMYLLFVGAVLHAAMGRTGAGLNLVQGLDLGVSIGAIIAMFRIALIAVARDGDVPAR